MARTLRSGKQGVPVDMSRFIKKNRKKIPSQDLREKFANMHLTPSPQSEANGPLVLPWELNQHIKQAVDIMKHLEANKDDKLAQLRLKATELRIDRIVTYRKASKDLPSDWEFDRATAINLVA